MSLKGLPVGAVMAPLLASAAVADFEPPTVIPTRDVEITYDVWRPRQPKLANAFAGRPRSASAAWTVLMAQPRSSIIGRASSRS
jgi:hypothetical protein